MMKKALVLLAVTGAVAASALVLEPVKLMRDVKAGDSHKMKVTVDIDFGGQMMTFSAENTQKVKEVKSDGTIIMEEVQANSEIDMGDGGQPAGMDNTATVSYDKTGMIKGIESPVLDDTSYRFASLMAFRFPDKEVDKGASWTLTNEANKEHATPKTTFKYTLDGIEDYKGAKTAKVSFEIKETEGTEPGSSKGFMWVDIKTGFIKKAEGSFTNLPTSQVTIPTAKFKIETI